MKDRIREREERERLQWVKERERVKERLDRKKREREYVNESEGKVGLGGQRERKRGER